LEEKSGGASGVYQRVGSSSENLVDCGKVGDTDERGSY
jgi:hypothetical protein